MKNIYFNEYNIPMENTIYLPLVSGKLAAYAKTFPQITEAYNFMPPLYKRDTPENILAQYINPSVAAFSVSLWNYNLSLEVAQLLKEKFPYCVTIFGGPSAPFNGTLPNVDYIINGEGERKFVNILARIGGLYPQVLEGIDKNIDCFPSPYVTGEFDMLLKDDMKHQAIIETNRGCPYLCAYCFWGQGGLNKQYRFHSLDYIQAEAEWLGRNKIEYVFCADSNFGMFEKDVEIAQIWADTKARFGYPEKVRVCYGKNGEDSIFQVAKILSKAGLAKAITLSRQTNNQEAMQNVNRKNIKKEVFDQLQSKYKAKGIPTYTEFILGLPGETMSSFKKGVMEALETSTKIFIYHCTVLPGTEMAQPEYIAKHGICTVRVPMSEIHCEIREPGAIQEYEDIIIQTNTMSKEEWIECAVNAWLIQLRHSFNITPIPNKIVCKFYEIACGITEGKPRGQVDLKFGNIYWEPEELAYLNLTYRTGNPKEFARRKILYGRKGK